MRADRDKCITCGSRDQSTSIPFQDLPYFFCCEDCHKKAVRKYLNKRYDFDADLSQDEDFQREWEEIDDAYAVIPEGHGLWAQLKGITEHNWKTPRQEALVERWHKARVDAIADAENEIYKRLRAELDHEEQEEAEELEKERLKQEEREAKERLQQEQQEAKQREHEEMLVEKPIPNRFRFEHSHVLGPSGSGKTTLLQNLLLEDLVKRWDEDRPVLKRNPPCYIVIDPKGLMIERLSKLSFFSDTVYKDKLVIIDPLSRQWAATRPSSSQTLAIYSQQQSRR